MIIWLPLEPLEQRYSSQWQKWFPAQLTKDKVPFMTIPGEKLTDKVNVGSVLDALGTNFWKMSQMANLIAKMQNGEISSGDILCFADLWYPGIEALRYISDLGGCHPKITGILHAGTWDPHDFLVRQGTRPWAHEIESAWFQIYDLIFVATQFHKDLILKSHNVDPNKIEVTGLPFYPDEFTISREHNEKITKYVIFPHRLDEEKRPQDFDGLVSELESEDVQFTHKKTAGLFLDDKNAYYDELSRAEICVSTALQETFGYIMLEATALGCIPLVPARLSYEELYPKEFQYHTFFELKNKLKSILTDKSVHENHLRLRDITAKHHRALGMSAITKMCEVIKKINL